METVNGTVEAVNTKFNGSLKIMGAWHNLRKGVENKAKVGDEVELTLEPWEFKGKTGLSVTSVKLLNVVVQASKVNKEPMVKGRDFDKEARGKTVCQYVTAQLSNPSIDNNDLKAIFDRAKKLMEMTFEVE